MPHPIFLALGANAADALKAVGQLPSPLNPTADGGLTIEYTDSSGAPGAATINKPAGKVAIALGAASVVVTNSFVTSDSIVLAVVQTADATLTFIKSVVPGAGSFTITGNAAATAATTVAFVVLN